MILPCRSGHDGGSRPCCGGFGFSDKNTLSRRHAFAEFNFSAHFIEHHLNGGESDDHVEAFHIAHMRQTNDFSEEMHLAAGDRDAITLPLTV